MSATKDRPDDHIPAPREHTPEVDAITDHETMAIYEKYNMDEAWLISDFKMEIVQ